MEQTGTYDLRKDSDNRGVPHEEEESRLPIRRHHEHDRVEDHVVCEGGTTNKDGHRQINGVVDVDGSSQVIQFERSGG